MRRQTDDAGPDAPAPAPVLLTSVAVLLHFDETDIMEALRGQGHGTVALHCTVRDASGVAATGGSCPGGRNVDVFTVDAALRSRTNGTSAAEKPSRVFYYLNGLLRTLVALRVRHPRARHVHVFTKSRYLSNNARLSRIARWKKHGFRGKDGREIKLRSLWEELWNITRFILVEVTPSTSSSS